ncbi:MAG: PH domain-containing protein [Bacilli bacterium]|nr:PH domain-containing protein [Bacilli bacterium]
MGKVYDQVCMFKAKYPGTITWWRLRKHAKVVEQHLNPDEEPLYSFAGQKNDDVLDVFSTCVICVTNKRILIGQDHIITGYTLTSITPDLFNDLKAYCGILFGKITIDTVKEEVVLTNLDKKSLPEIETAVTKQMMEEKKKYIKPKQ